MARRFKLKLACLLSSFRFCRPKQPSTFLANQIRQKYNPTGSGVYRRELHICRSNQPPPPPSTPIGFFGGHLSAKIKSIGYDCNSKSRKLNFPNDCRSRTPDHAWNRKSGLMRVVQRGIQFKTGHKLHYRKLISGGNDRNCESPPRVGEKRSKKKSKKKGRKSFLAHISMANNWSAGYEGEEEETEALISSSMSFSNDFSYKLLNHQVKPIIKKEKSNLIKGLYGRTKTAFSTTPKETKTACASATREIIQSKEEGRLRESFVMVKRSEEPYEEFKRSMMEMILKKEIFNTKGLEELLRCFLTLNSPIYRGVIVEAFSDVWEILFSDY